MTSRAALDPAAFPAKASDRCRHCGRLGRWKKDCLSAFRTRHHRSKDNASHLLTKPRQFQLRSKKGRRVFVTMDDSDTDCDSGEEDDDQDTAFDGQQLAFSEGESSCAYWGRVGKQVVSPSNPPAKGAHVKYRSYAQEAHTGSVVLVTVFLDSGSVACWIPENLSRRIRLRKYRAPYTTTSTGISDGGHAITHNAIIHLFFSSTPGFYIASSCTPGTSGRVSVMWFWQN